MYRWAQKERTGWIALDVHLWPSILLPFKGKDLADVSLRPRSGMPVLSARLNEHDGTVSHVVLGTYTEFQHWAFRPEVRTVVAALALSGAIVVLSAWLGISTMPLRWRWWSALNLVTASVFVLDKVLSTHNGLSMRVPESALLTLALFGGSLGAIIGMRGARHKTAKPTFLLQLFAVLAVQVAVVWYNFFT